MRKTISIGLVGLLAFAGGALAAVTTVEIANAALPGVKTGDSDGDRIPDRLETELCSRQLTRDQLALAQAGRCLDPKNYLPPEERHLVPLYLILAPGTDADGDLLPKSVKLTSTVVTIDPFQTDKDIVRFSASADSIDVPVDTDDADASQPVVMKVTSPIEIPIDIAIGRDGDRDLLPGGLTLKWATLTVDRSSLKAVYKFSSPTSQLVAVDSDDADADMPAVSFVDISLPMKVTHSGDMDNDLLPGAISVAMDTYKFDRRLGSLELKYLGRTTTTKAVDEDEGNRDNMVPLSAIDADVDFVPDAVESIICMVQSESSDDDGRCVRKDGSGEDGSGANFVGPVSAPNPWSFDPS